MAITRPHGHTLGAQFAPSWHRPWFRYVEPVAGAEGATPPASEDPKPEPPTTAETDWKSEARKWENRAKENLAAAKANETAAKRLADIEEASKTEAQKAAERLAELESEVTSYKTREQIAQWKAEVAEATGVPAGVLAGTTREEIEAHAETLKPLIQQTAQPGPVVPNEGTGTGAASKGGVSQLSKSDLDSMTPEQINKARREGRLNKVLGIS